MYSATLAYTQTITKQEKRELKSTYCTGSILSRPFLLFDLPPSRKLLSTNIWVLVTERLRLCIVSRSSEHHTKTHPGKKPVLLFQRTHIFRTFGVKQLNAKRGIQG